MNEPNKKRGLMEYLKNQYLEFCLLVFVLFAVIIKSVFFLISYLLRNSLFPFNGPSSFVFLLLQFFLVALFIYLVSWRIKTKTFFEAFLIYRIIKSTPLAFKTLLLLIIPFFLILLFGMLLTVNITMGGYTFIGFFFSVLLLLIISLGFVDQIARIKATVINISNGENTEEFNTDGLYLDTQEISKQLLNIDEGLKKALEESMKAERLKTELITNVSHDIRTPLTSIINYVDLLKKLEVKEEPYSSYLGILERNSNRLKFLINDLIEASKTSTGNVEVKMEELDLVELVAQAYGSFDRLFNEKELEFVFEHPENEVYIMADGDHMWRVLDNVFSNVIKYALNGTRVYGDIYKDDEHVHFRIKNISEAQLNISEDELMEQFVRGEKSRHTEGSGLGLYIARSLMSLMEGTLKLRIDGDLFEVELLLKPQ